MPFNDNYTNIDTSIFNPQDEPVPVLNYGSDYINSMAGITSQMKGGSTLDSFEKVRTNLAQFGSDPQLDEIKQESMSEQAESALELSQSVILDDSIDPEDRVDIIQKIGEESLKATPDIIGRYADYNIENPMPYNTEEELQANLKKQGTGVDISTASSEINRALTTFMNEYQRSQGDESTASLLRGTAEIVIFPGQETVYKKIFETALPALGSTLTAEDYLLVGSAKTKLRSFMDSLTFEDRIIAHRKLLEVLPEFVGVISDSNSIEVMLLAQDITNIANPLVPYSELQKELDNFIGIIDSLPLVGILSKGAKLAKAGIGSMRNATNVEPLSNISVLSKSDPSKAQEVALEQISQKSGSKLEEATGASAVDIILDHSMLKTSHQAIPKGFDAASATRDYKKVFGKGTDTVDYKANKAARADAQVDKTLSRLMEKVPFIQLSKSKAIKTNVGIDYEVIIGQTDTIGFQSLGEAHAAARGFHEADSGYKVLAQNKKGEMIPEEELDLSKLSEVDEYFVELKSSQKYDSEDLLELEGSASLLVKDGATGEATKYLDPSSWLIPPIIRKVAAAVNQAARFSKEVNELLRPYTKLKKTPWKQAKVLKAIQYGEKDGKWLDVDDLIEQFDGENLDLIDAYYGFKRAADVTYLEQNARLFKKLDVKGYLDIKVNDWHSIGVPLKTQDELKQVNVVYDPKTKSYIDMTQSDLNALFGQNKMISRNIDFISEVKANGRIEGTYYVVHAIEGLSELPPYVLNYRPGYIPRTYDQPYKVVETITDVIVNGKKSKDGISRAVQFASGSKAAIREADKLEGVTPGAKYKAEPTRELLNATEDFDAIFDEARSQGRMYFSKRGQELGGLDGKRTVGNITDSMSRMIASMTKNHALGGIVEDLKGSWLKSYKKFTPDGQNFPTSSKGMKMTSDLKEEAEFDRAVSMMNYINHISGQNNGLGVKMWRKKISQLANLIESTSDTNFFSKGRNALANSLLDKDSLNPFTLFMNIGRSPLSVLKAATFVKVIAFNPIRQAVINLAQMSVYAGVDGGGAYMLKTSSRQGWIAEHSMLLAGTSSRNMSPLNKNRIRTATLKMINSTAPFGKKITLKDIDDITEDFHKSGLMQNIDGHQFLTSTVTERADSVIGGSALGTVGKYAKEYLIQAPVSIGKKGFVLGETANISTAWLVARNGVRKSDPKANLRSEENIQYMSGRASEISYNMNKSGELAYQQGALSGFFQFMSVQQKALQALTPNIKFLGLNKIAGRQFNTAEKAKIAAVQTGMFGAAGLGLTTAYNSLVELSGVTISPQDNAIIEGGFVDYMINGVGELATGEQQNILASRSLAPISAVGDLTGIGNIFSAAFSVASGQGISGQPLTALDALGASGSLVSAFGSLVETVRYVSLQEKANLATPQDYNVIRDASVSMLSSGISNYMKARLYTNYGREFTTNGIAKFKTTEYEQWGKALFGLQNRANLDLNALTFEMIAGSKKGGSDPLPMRKSIQSDAKFLYDLTNRFAVQNTEGELHKNKLNEHLRAVSIIYNMAYTDVEKDALMSEYSKLMKHDNRLEPAELKLPVAMIEVVGRGWVTSKHELIQKIERLDTKGEYKPFIELMRRELPSSSSSVE